MAVRVRRLLYGLGGLVLAFNVFVEATSFGSPRDEFLESILFLIVLLVFAGLFWEERGTRE